MLELRQYTLKPGQRDTLIALFDRNFIESQEAVGMTVVGQFRDRNRPDRFVWMRGFSDMGGRHAALERFYGGPVWAEHKAAANATMLDVSDVALLRPARLDTAFHLDSSARPALAEARTGESILVGIHRIREAVTASTVAQFERTVIPQLRREAVRLEALFVTEPATNTFTRLPVREGEHLIVWIGAVQRGDTLPADRLWKAIAGWSTLVDGDPVILELTPTERSLLGHHAASR